MLAILLACLLAFSHVAEASLTIGAFNIQRLSDNKVANATVLHQIAQILSRFDMVAVEEVLHTTAMDTVLAELNRISPETYSVTMSTALGRTSYKEHLAILYKSGKMTVRRALQYPDDVDNFERAPYSVLFHTTHSSMTDFTVMAVHIKPSDALKEMDALVPAYEYVSSHFATNDFLITGDFNADCRYLSDTRLHHSRLWTDPRFFFLPPAASTDTTVNSNTDCQYDRFVVAGSPLRAAAVPSSVKVYDFQTDMGLSYEEAKKISDHFPIEMQLD